VSTAADDLVVPVLIVGAGPTGVSAATMLAQRGIDSLLIDRYAAVYPLPRAVHLDDEVHRILQGMGVADAFAGISEPRQGLVIVDNRLRIMARFDRTRTVGDHGWPQANFFDQPEFEEALRANLRRFPGTRIQGRRELVRFEQDVTGGKAPVRAVVRDLDSGEETVVWAKALLGCDGANSTVRDLIGSTLVDLKFEERWLVIDVSSPQPLDVLDVAYQVSDSTRPATFMKVLPGRYRWEFRLNEGETVDDLCAPGRFSELIRPWTQDVPIDDLTIMRTAEYTFRARIADRWQDRRTFLLGDAAHLTPPFIGQGLCAALRDASNLCWKLAAVLDGGAPESLLSTYQEERFAPAKNLVRKAVMLGTAMSGGPGYASFLRRAVLAALCRVPGISDRVLDTPSPPLAISPLVKRDKKHPLPGTLAPQPWLVVDGVRRRADDVLGSGFSVVTVVAPDPQTQELAKRLQAPIVLIASSALPAGVVPDVDAIAVDEDAVLLTWLRAAGASTVILRPDRVVLLQSTNDDRHLGVDDLDPMVGTPPLATPVP
jgi:3-(3-hydroxy-phenyl)propionate hydroxylase